MTNKNETPSTAPAVPGDLQAEIDAKLASLLAGNPTCEDPAEHLEWLVGGVRDVRDLLASVAIPGSGDLLKFAGQLVDEINGLISESEGVAGLHLNGDVAPWDELAPGGQFERLTSLDDLRTALLATPHQAKDDGLTAAQAAELESLAVYLKDDEHEIDAENIRAAVAAALSRTQARPAADPVGVKSSAEGLADYRAGKGFIKPEPSRAGKPPCGECHLKPGETCDICDAHEPANRPASQAPAASAGREGAPEFVLVPREPTKAMLQAGVEGNPTLWSEETDRGFARDVAHDVYASMLQAAALAPAAQPGPASLQWHPASEEPAVGRKIVGLWDDGSGACLLYRHDGGYIDQDGEDSDRIGISVSRWAYLPGDHEFFCEHYAGDDEEPMHLHVDETTDAILAARLGAEGVAGWQDISTAPKDGTKIDLWGFWPEKNENRRSADASWLDGDWFLGQYQAHQYAYPPTFTHWSRPTSPSPTPASGAESGKEDAL